MNDKLYKDLRQHLDNLPGGFPETSSGVELKILKHLFTLEEASLALNLTLMSEDAATIAYRINRPLDETKKLLETMAFKGLILRSKDYGKAPKYMALQYIVGIWELQVGRLTPQLVKYMEEYVPQLMDVKIWKKTPQMRTIPVNQSIDNSLEVMTYENAYQLLDKKKNFVISPCICRKEMAMEDKACKKPVEVCISFGNEEDFFLKNNVGKKATKQEVIEVLKLADKAGLVLQPNNGKDINWLCCCCGCCCAILRTARTYPKPAKILSSPFIAKADLDLCTGCGVCVKRCQIDAIKIEDKKIKIDYDRCIGCGLCITTCKPSALKLERKPAGTFPSTSHNIVSASLKILHQRKKTNPMELTKMVGKSFKDRYKSKDIRKNIND